MKVLLVGNGGCYNRGCEAILRATLSLLREKFDNPEIIVAAYDPKQEKKHEKCYHNTRIVRTRLNKFMRPYSWQCMLSYVYPEMKKPKWSKLEFLPLWSSIKKVDVVLSLGGDNFSLDYGFPRHFLALNTLAREYGKKMVIWGASVGPFTGSDRLKEIVDNLSKVDLITVRETCSFEHLRSLGISDNVRLTADPAFLLPAEPVDFQTREPTRPIVGINISPILSSYIKGNTISSFVSETTTFIRKLIDTFDVLLIPHVTASGNKNNDHIFMKKIYEAIPDTSAVKLVAPVYDSQQTKYLISKCHFFIGARTHSTIASLSSGIPTLSIGYSLKAKGINQDIFGSDEFLLDIKDYSTGAILNLFRKMIERQDEIRQILKQRVPDIQARARKNMDHLQELLGPGYP